MEIRNNSVHLLLYAAVVAIFLMPAMGLCSHALVLNDGESFIGIIGIFIISNSIGGISTNPTSVILDSPLDSKLTDIEKQVFGAQELTNKTKVSNSTDTGLLKNVRNGRKRRFRVKKVKSKSRRKSRPYFHTSSETEKFRQDLNSNEVVDPESFRRKILSQLGAVDPLLCLPKALCGISSRRQQNPDSNPTDDIDISPITLMDENSINNYLEIMKIIVPKSDSPTWKKKKKSKGSLESESNSNSESSEESEEIKPTLLSDDLVDDDLEYYKQKAQVAKWMHEDDYDPDPNWWDMLPPNKPYYSIDETPPRQEESSWSSYSPYRISKALFGAFMPSVSWGFGKAPDVFAEDPFFQNFRSFSGRSMNNGDRRSFKWFFGKSDKLGQAGTAGTKSFSRNKIRGVKGRKNKNVNRERYLDQRKGELNMIDDPVEKFQLAVEIGKQMDDPKQCDYVFTGCPFAYQEIIGIIESSKKSAVEEHHKGTGQEMQNEDFETQTPVNSSGATTHTIPLGDNMEITLKISDSDEGTLVPHVSVVKSPGHLTKQPTTLTTYYNNRDKHTKDEEEHPHETSQEAVVDESKVNSNQNQEMVAPELPIPEASAVAPTPLRTALPAHSDSLEYSAEVTTEATPTTTPLKRRQRRPKPNKNHYRPQWGWGIPPRPQRPAPSRPPTSTILKQSHTHTRTNTKYQPLPLPTTINKPSHVINYHFHNTNTNPHISPSNSPLQSQIHLPPVLIATPQPPTTTTTTTTSKPDPIRDRDSVALRDNIDLENLPESRVRKRPNRNSLLNSSEERIIIRLPESPSPSNNYYNYLYPNIPLLSNFYSTPQPQPSPQPGHYHSQYQPIIPTPSPSPFYYSQPFQSNRQPHQQFQPFYNPPTMFPSPAPGMFSYFFGKK